MHSKFQMLNYKSDAILLANGAERSSIFDDPVRLWTFENFDHSITKQLFLLQMSRQRKIGLFSYIFVNVCFLITLVTVVALGIEYEAKENNENAAAPSDIWEYTHLDFSEFFFHSTSNC